MTDADLVARAEEAAAGEVEARAAGEPLLRQGRDRIHSGEDSIAPFAIAASLPLGEPGADERAPAGAELEEDLTLGQGPLGGDRAGPAGRLGAGAARVDLAADVDMDETVVAIEQVAHQVADAFVGGQIIIDAAIGRIGD